MTRRRTRNAGVRAAGKQKVIGFRLDEGCGKRLLELAADFGTTENQYARGVLTRHLLAAGEGATEACPTEGLAELGEFLQQVRDELKEVAERQGQRLEAMASRLQALTSHTQALTKKVLEVDARLADFLERVDPM